MTTAFEYTLKAGGLVREEDYPYTGRDRGPCKFDKSKIAASVSNFSVVSLDEDQIAANLVKNGPLAGSLFFFTQQAWLPNIPIPCPLPARGILKICTARYHPFYFIFSKNKID